MGLFSRHKVPDKSFSHADDCKIMRADPTAEIKWSEVEMGLWVAECVCRKEYHRDPAVPQVRQDPRDPKTARHAPQCELAQETEPGVLKLALKATERDGYWWTECSACEYGWQVLFYAAEPS